MNILIIGKTIAQELSQLIKSYQPKWSVSFHTHKGSRPAFKEKLMRCDAICVAISTKDDGSAALSYILDAIAAGKYVITCEKGSLSEYFIELRPYLDRIRYMTTVGGASGMLSLLYHAVDVRCIKGIVNGTTNKISCLMEIGHGFYEAGKITQEGSTAEPGNKTVMQLVLGEFVDTCQKAVILHNLAYPYAPIRRSRCGYLLPSETALESMFRKGRLVVHVGNQAEMRFKPQNPVFWYRSGPQFLYGEFERNVEEFSFMPQGADNCLFVEDSGGYHFACGCGADAKKTAGALLSELKGVEQLINTDK